MREPAPSEPNNRILRSHTIKGPAPSALEEPHLGFVVVAPSRDGQVVQPGDLLGCKREAVCAYVLLEPRDSPRPRDGDDVAALCQEPGDRHLSRSRGRLGGDPLYLVGDAEVALEVLAHEARIGLAPVALRKVVERADGSGQEAVLLSPTRDRLNKVEGEGRYDGM